MAPMARESKEKHYNEETERELQMHISLLN